MRIGRRRPALPVLVVGGEADAVFPACLNWAYTAARWQAEVAVIPAAGHTLMLDAHWQAAADTMADWLAWRMLPGATAQARD
jgi:pimeloyl-ACP methyl ester carboxylesterase